MTEATVAIVGTLLTGGLITAIVSAFKARAESRKTDTEADAVGAKTPAEVESISILTMTNALNGARAINEDYKEQLAALRTDLETMSERQTTDRRELHEELEDAKRQIDSLRKGLAAAHQYVTILLTWIEERLPDETPPSPPSGYTQTR